MNSKKNSTKIPDKKTMNLCMRDESATDWTTLGIGLAIILVMVFLVAKWGVIEIKASADALKGIKGKHALYFVFGSPVEDKSICKLYDFRFTVR